MNDKQRRKIKPIFNSLDPEAVDLLPFPPKGDDGDGNGDDHDLASIIYFGSTGEITERQLEFAIQLGRALERAGVSYDQK